MSELNVTSRAQICYDPSTRVYSVALQSGDQTQTAFQWAADPNTPSGNSYAFVAQKIDGTVLSSEGTWEYIRDYVWGLFILHLRGSVETFFDNEVPPPRSAMWKFGEPHFVDSEDCMGNPRKYWRAFAKHPNLDTVMGTGDSPEAASASLKLNVLNVKKQDGLHQFRYYFITSQADNATPLVLNHHQILSHSKEDAIQKLKWKYPSIIILLVQEGEVIEEDAFFWRPL